ncbi:hypothetical protein BVX98_00075 [bacterium F11]|nr:hypothetical protein BVX98_00075 [bacterium F11]
MKKDQSNLKILGYYLFLPIFYFALRFFFEREWIFGGEMHSEMATNYFLTTLGEFKLGRLLFALDAGYFPLPQRLIALAGRLMSLPAQAIPFFYTWSALIITPLLIGTFVLKPFRALVPRDNVRFAVTLMVLISVDFETRTFTNFTYTAMFVFIALSALALEISQEEDFPLWSWVMLPFVLSKPYMLTLTPAILVILYRKKSFRIRAFFGITALLIGIQLLRLLLSAAGGTLANNRSADYNLFQNLIAGGFFFFIQTGQFIFGPLIGKNVFDWGAAIIYGLLGGWIITMVAILLPRRQNKPQWLIWTGLSVIFCNVFINCLTLSVYWNIEMERAFRAIIYRWNIIMFFSSILIVATLIGQWSESRWPTKLHKIPVRWRPLLAILLWFAITGWLKFTVRNSKIPKFPTLGLSDWQRMAHLIQDNHRPLCVPINPHGWFFSRDSVLLETATDWRNPFIAIEAQQEIDIPLPPPHFH